MLRGRTQQRSAHAVLRIFARRRRTGGACVPSCTLHANVPCLARRVVRCMHTVCSATLRCVRLCPRTSARYAMVCVAAIRRTATVPVPMINKTQDYYQIFTCVHVVSRLCRRFEERHALLFAELLRQAKPKPSRMNDRPHAVKRAARLARATELARRSHERRRPCRAVL
jgi:hypothetical protein